MTANLSYLANSHLEHDSQIPGAELLLAIAEKLALGVLTGCHGDNTIENPLAAFLHRLLSVENGTGVDIHVVGHLPIHGRVVEARVTEGEWCSAFGRQEAVHSGDFMGIPATHKKIEIRYMDFWKVVDGKIVDNWVMVDFPSILQQLGVDPFGGHGWEKLDSQRAPIQNGEES
ncbi:ester cyclase [Porticoccaceae bacterium]|nr:ester cyclase [Porticoccaceae bacterium]MDB9999185.1 ester cyclase [Porticoccaceae bacterium]MDC0003195.1 ester cyclase [Porticoccaceae bacterium]